MWFSPVLARSKRALIQPVALFQILGQTSRSQAINSVGDSGADQDSRFASIRETASLVMTTPA